MDPQNPGNAAGPTPNSNPATPPAPNSTPEFDPAATATTPAPESPNPAAMAGVYPIPSEVQPATQTPNPAATPGLDSSQAVAQTPQELAQSLANNPVATISSSPIQPVEPPTPEGPSPLPNQPQEPSAPATQPYPVMSASAQAAARAKKHKLIGISIIIGAILLLGGLGYLAYATFFGSLAG